MAGQSATTPGERHVLIVDDDDATRRLCCRLLKRLKVTPLEAGSAQEAMLVSRVHTGFIDLIICDIEMPGLSGPELIRRLSAQRPDSQVLFITGYVAESAALHGISGEHPVLAKPFTPVQLCNRLSELLGIELTL